MNKNFPIVVNLFGGPGVGKSSLRADVFSKLKWSNINCEESYEYVKAKVWEDSLNSIKNQFYIFGKQHNQQFRLINKVDVIVTDAPLFNSILYDKTDDELFRQIVLREFNQYHNINFLINRTKPYNPNGRFQTEEGAKLVDMEAYKMLQKYGVEYETINGGPESSNEIVKKVLLVLNTKTINV